MIICARSRSPDASLKSRFEPRHASRSIRPPSSCSTEKSWRIAAAVAVYLALFQKHKLAPGEKGVALVLAASVDQARTVLRMALVNADREIVRKIMTEPGPRWEPQSPPRAPGAISGPVEHGESSALSFHHQSAPKRRKQKANTSKPASSPPLNAPAQALSGDETKRRKGLGRGAR
jgi:hypothetical protein